LSRYTFEFKSSGGIWTWIGAAIATIALVAATIISFGGTSVASAVGISGMFSVLGGATTLGGVAVATSVTTMAAVVTTTAIAGGVAIGAAVVTGAVASTVNAIGYAVNKNDPVALDGKNTKAPAMCEIAEVKDSRKLD
jgi:hypothetical protein